MKNQQFFMKNQQIFQSNMDFIQYSMVLEMLEGFGRADVKIITRLETYSSLFKGHGALSAVVGVWPWLKKGHVQSCLLCDVMCS